MDVVVAHNFYQQPGGEDHCVAAEIALLQAHGHNVIPFTVHNDQIKTMNTLDIGLKTIWSLQSFSEMRQLFRRHRPRVAHFHNTFPLISPAAYYAARAEGVAVVQTLHNFRILCGNAVFYRDGQVCEACLGRPVAWPGIAKGCYHNSRSATAAVAAMSAVHRAVGTWTRSVDRYIALTEFGRDKFVNGGLPADRIDIKPNFIQSDSGPGDHSGKYAAYIGRLSAEKGIETLLEGWRHLGETMPLKIAGDGPLAPLVMEAAAQNPAIKWLGRRSPAEVAALIGDAAFVVVPSRCYEMFPRVLVEAFAKGTPVIVAGFGAMATIVEDGRTGLFFRPGDGEDLARKVGYFTSNLSIQSEMQRAARSEFVNKFTSEANYDMLMGVYDRASLRVASDPGGVEMQSARALASAGDPFHDSHASSRPLPLSSETAFYSRYTWCLDPHLKIGNARHRLADEVSNLNLDLCDWQIREVATNIYLLAGALLNCVDEYLRGPGLKVPKRLTDHRLGRLATRILDGAADASQLKRHLVRQWRYRLLSALDEYLPCLLFPNLPSSNRLYASAGGLASLARSGLPSALEAQLIGIPSPFRRLDLTHHDTIALGRQLIARFPDRSRSILLIGLRTSGSFFAPLIRCFLQNQGYQSVAFVTVQPDKGPGRQESADLKRYARQSYTGVIVDDAPHSGGAVLRAVDLTRSAGFARDRIIALVPLHPAHRNCFGALTDTLVVSLPAERWHKSQLMDLVPVRARLVEYYSSEGFPFVQVAKTARTNQFEMRLNSTSFDDRGARLKRVFEVKIRSARGEETRFVLAKSVGWGWLGYHAFIAATELSGLVPRLLGLRDGILYTEWIPQPAAPPRESLLDASANYIAVRSLRLRIASRSGSRLQRHENGMRLLAKICAKSYAPFLVDQLMRPRVERWLATSCPQPTFIDGKMQVEEWIATPNGFLKSDFEHHGMGKGEVNNTDPAFDLAQTILELEADRAEEQTLLQRYAELSGDATIANRMFQQKLLAGAWAMERARQQLFDKSHDAARAHALHERYARAWNFLTVHAARECGRLCQPTSGADWELPIIVVDVDGVIDRRTFGFPCTTAAGIEAFSVLRAHDRAIVLNTARSAAEVREYCDAYQLAGGIAEHGSYLWDAVAQQGRVLLDSEAIQQLGILRQHLAQIPGVFLDNRHHYSIRAFTYRKTSRDLDGFLSASLRPKGADTVPLSPLVMNDLLARTGLTRLAFHQTSIDTAVVVKETNKGTGLKGFTDWLAAGKSGTIAIGNSRPDLDMFRVATRSFAPAHIGCRAEARLLGCRIASKPYQRGFAEIARLIVHSDEPPCERCADAARMGADDNPWIRFLQAADRSFAANLARGLFHRSAFEALLRR